MLLQLATFRVWSSSRRNPNGKCRLIGRTIKGRSGDGASKSRVKDSTIEFSTQKPLVSGWKILLDEDKRTVIYQTDSKQYIYDCSNPDSIISYERVSGSNGDESD